MRVDLARGELGDDRRAGSTRAAKSAPARRGEVERAVLERLEESEQKTLALFVPEWVGIANATRHLFDVLHPLPAELSRDDRSRLFHLLDAAQLENLVFSGGAVDHLHLARELHDRYPGTQIKLLWHGNLLQVKEDYAWRGLRLSLELARRGVVKTLGFVKEGLAEFAEELGLSARFVLNYVPELPEQASQPGSGGPHFGMWISNEGWRKPPYAMAAAVRRVRGGRLHTGSANPRLSEFANLIGLRTDQHGETLLDWPQLARWMRQMHLNLYVTVSECCPMLPLESLSVGTPCLTGPTSHLFRDDPYLNERLVVPIPDSEACIHEKIERALAERDQIVEAYRRWAPFLYRPSAAKRQRVHRCMSGSAAYRRDNIFVVGCQRSGTSAVWASLVAHPELKPLHPYDATTGYDPKELYYFRNIFEARRRFRSPMYGWEIDRRYLQTIVDATVRFCCEHHGAASGPMDQRPPRRRAAPGPAPRDDARNPGVLRAPPRPRSRVECRPHPLVSGRSPAPSKNARLGRPNTGEPSPRSRSASRKESLEIPS